ncbi:hypothetical protein EON81_03890 [bacterium]|nr:MAG: hypothetical protein EON81_03890 [bacterium]
MRFHYGRDVPDQPTLWTVEDPALTFVLRRHHATRLHWDLRIRANGMLYSWCLDQPPSVNPRRTVRMKLQPPHDPEYMLSERRIPDGYRGAGQTLPEDYGGGFPHWPGEGSQDRRFHESFLAGQIDISLEGRFLRGLYRLKEVGREWKILKLEDRFAASAEPQWPARSIFTNRHIYDL